MPPRVVLLLLCFGLSLRLAGAEAQSFVLDKAHSQVRAEVRATLDAFSCKVDDYELRALVNPETLELQQGSFSFRFLDLKTGKNARDRKMHAWQNTEKFPEVSFVISSVAVEPSRQVLSGKLRLHGISRQILIPITLKRSGERCVMEGEAFVDCREYLLPSIKVALLLKVDPLVRVKFHLEGKLLTQ